MKDLSSIFEKSYNFLEECEAMDPVTRGEFQLLRMSEMAVEDKRNDECEKCRKSARLATYIDEDGLEGMSSNG